MIALQDTYQTNLADMSKEEQRSKLEKDRLAFQATQDGESFEIIDENFMSSIDDLNNILDKIASRNMILSSISEES